jgi:hypothetical protein
MNKKIFWDTPEDIGPAEIILKIFDKFGIKDDTLSEKPKLVEINNLAKNLFAKKTTENSFISETQVLLNTTKETAQNILKDLKFQLFIYGKEITIPLDNEETSKLQTITNSLSDDEELPGIIKLPENLKTNQQNIEKITTSSENIPPKNYKKTAEKTTPLANKNSGGSDKYRETL